MTNMELFIVIISILSPISVGLFIQAGVKAQIKANDINISKQVKEELEKEKKLLVEKIKLERKDRWWKLKFDLFQDLEKSFTNITAALWSTDKEYFVRFKRELSVIDLRFLSLFENLDLTNDISKIRAVFNKSKQERQSVKSGEIIGGAYMDAIIKCKKELGIG